MNWRHLGIAASLFNSDGRTAVYPTNPCDPRKERHYLESLEQEKTPESVINFLNKWGRMRHGYSESSVQNGLLGTYPAVSKLRGKSFETANLTPS